MVLSDTPDFLRERATRADIVRAFTINTSAWLVRYAESGGGTVYQKNGVLLTYKPRDGGTGAVPFPRIPSSDAGNRIDAIVGFYTDQHPFHGALYWSTRPVKSKGLEAPDLFNDQVTSAARIREMVRSPGQDGNLTHVLCKCTNSEIARFARRVDRQIVDVSRTI